MEINANLSKTKDLGRKPYGTPKVILRQPLEALAGVCDSNDPTNGKDSFPCTTINS